MAWIRDQERKFNKALDKTKQEAARFDSQFGPAVLIPEIMNGIGDTLTGVAQFVEHYGSIQYITSVLVHWRDVLEDPFSWLSNGPVSFVGYTPVGPGSFTNPTLSLSSDTVSDGGSTKNSKVYFTAKMSEPPARGSELSPDKITVSNGRILEFRQRYIKTVPEFFGTSDPQPEEEFKRYQRYVYGLLGTYDFTLVGMQEGPVSISIQGDAVIGLASKLSNLADPPVTYSFTSITSTLVLSYSAGGALRISAQDGEVQQDFSAFWQVPSVMGKQGPWNGALGRFHTMAPLSRGTCVVSNYYEPTSFAPANCVYRGRTGNLREILSFSGEPKPIFTERPSVLLSSITVAAGATTHFSQVVMKATFSQPVYDFSPSSIVVTNGLAPSGFDTISPDRTEWTFTIDGMDDQQSGGEVTVTIPQGVARNSNTTPLTNTASLTYSFAKGPTPAFLYLSSPNVAKGGTISGSSATLTASLLTEISTPIVEYISNDPGIPQGQALSGWFKPDSLSLAQGDLVSSWSSSSETAQKAVAASGRQPTFQANALNGLPAVSFAGNQEFVIPYSSLDSPTGDDLSIFIVYQNLSSSATSAPLVGKASQASGWGTPGYSWGVSAKNTASTYLPVFNFGSSSSTTATVTSSSGPSLNSPTILSLVKKQSSGTIQMFLNGALSGSLTGITQDPKVSESAIYIGGNQKLSASETFSGKVFEILVYSAALSDDQRKRVEGYLAHRFALTSLLPADHPNKTTSPSIPPYYKSNMLSLSGAKVNSVSKSGRTYSIGLTDLQPGTVSAEINTHIVNPITRTMELLYADFNFLVPSSEAIFSVVNRSVGPGSSLAVTMQGSNLSSQPALASDTYLRSSANWKRVVLTFRTFSGLSFVYSLVVGVAGNRRFKVSAPAGTVYYLQKVIIEGKNGTTLTIRRANLPGASSLDITVSA